MAKVIDDDQVDALFDKLTIGKRFELGEIRIPTGKQLLDQRMHYPGKSASFAPIAPHTIDRDGCNGVKADDIRSANLAHELYDAFAWVEWVSVQRVLACFVVKVKHSYPIDIRPDLRRWLVGHAYAKKWGATFELQVKELDPAAEGDLLKGTSGQIYIDDVEGLYEGK